MGSQRLQRGAAIMRISKEALSVCVVVQRAGVGAAPFGWAIKRLDTDSIIHFSSERFRSMDAAYRAGQARLSEFIPKRSMPPGVTENRLWQSRQIGPRSVSKVPERSFAGAPHLA
jgi:hypothetical protein